MSSTIPIDPIFPSNHERTLQPATLDNNHPRPFSMVSTSQSKSSNRICGMCKTGDKRRLVVCIDGTSKQFGLKNSNVVELYKRVEKSEEQLTYYNSGIGTYARKKSPTAAVKDFFDNLVDRAIAWHVKRRILDAYTWLSDKDGDQIYLFGFSRGAYQIRALAGMIETVGIIHRGNKEQIPFAYQLYLSHRRDRKSDRDLTKHFKEAFSREAKVHFVGVWDTVSSVGIIGRRKLPLTKESDHICYVRHALALDECRINFQPEYVKPPQNISRVDPDSDQVDEINQTISTTSGVVTSEDLSQERVKEVWFAGSHSDIGGGLLHNPGADLGDVPVLWMVNQAMLAGLQLHYQKGWDLQKIRSQQPTNSMGLLWRILEVLPVRHLQPGSTRSNIIRRYRWNLCRGRVILDGQKIHASLALKPHEYMPKASGINWSELRPGSEEFNPDEADLNEWLRYTSLLDSNRWDKDVYDFSVTLPFWFDQIRNGMEGPFHALRAVSPDPTILLGQQIVGLSTQKIVTSIVGFMESLDPTRDRLLQQAADYLLPLLRDREISQSAASALSDSIATLEGVSKGLLLTGLGEFFLRRYEWTSDHKDLDRAILELDQARPLVSQGRPCYLLGTCYYRRFRRLKESQDIENSISAFEIGLKSVPHDPMLLMNAANALLARDELYGLDDKDINQSVAHYDEAIRLTPDGHHHKPFLLYSLSNALCHRFQKSVVPGDIDRAIILSNQAVELTQETDPGHRATFLGQSGKVYCERFRKRKDLSDLSDIRESISKFDEGLHISQNDDVCRANLLNLSGSALLVQFQNGRDNISAIDNAFQRITESIAITDEKDPIRRARLQNLAAVVTEAVCQDLFIFGNKLDTLIDELRKMLQDEPDDGLLLTGVGMSLYARFRARGTVDDILQSISLLEQANKITSEESEKQMLSNQLKRCYLSRPSA